MTLAGNLNTSKTGCATGIIAHVDPDVRDVVADRGHLVPCRCDHHDARCMECGMHVTVGRGANIEYGHARAHSRRDTRADCPHRPTSLNPSQPWARQGAVIDDE